MKLENINQRKFSMFFLSFKIFLALNENINRSILLVQVFFFFSFSLDLFCISLFFLYSSLSYTYMRTPSTHTHTHTHTHTRARKYLYICCMSQKQQLYRLSPYLQSICSIFPARIIYYHFLLYQELLPLFTISFIRGVPYHYTNFNP